MMTNLYCIIVEQVMAAESSDEMLAVLTGMKEERQETVLPAVLYRAVHGVRCRCWRRRWTGGRATAARWTPGPSPTPPPPHSSDRPVTTACCTYQISRPEYCGGYSSVQLVRAAVSSHIPPATVCQCTAARLQTGR